MSNNFKNINCDIKIEVFPKDLFNASATQLQKFSFEVTQDIINPSNNDMTVEQYRETLFQNRLSSVKKNRAELGIDNKYIPYLVDLISKFPTFNFTDAYISETQNELWVIADYVDSEVSKKFFDIAFNLWDNIFIDVDILFIGENELNRELMPSDMIHFPVFVGV